MILVATFIVFLMIFVIIIDFFAVLFRLTGIPIKKARFQVISLLTSTGYTTKESELIVQHPIRRKLASILMMISYASTVTIISFLVNIITNSLINVESTIMIVVFIGMLIILFKSSLLESIENIMEYLVENSSLWKKINHKYLNFIVKNKGYGICEVYLCENNNLVGMSIRDSNLKNIEVQILNIDKGHELINFPSAEYVFEGNDKLTVYGNIHSIKNRFN